MRYLIDNSELFIFKLKKDALKCLRRAIISSLVQYVIEDIS